MDVIPQMKSLPLVVALDVCAPARLRGRRNPSAAKRVRLGYSALFQSIEKNHDREDP